MQRRKPNGRSAHIAPPSEDSDAATTPSEKTSRLNQRVLGLPNRIWLIITLFLILLSITHYVLPSSSYSNAYNTPLFSNADLKPKNYINASDSALSEAKQNPFAFCPLYGPGDDIGGRYGIRTMEQSRLHLGSGARVQRVIHRALQGLPVTISVIGGSVSACHGAGDDPISPTCYPSKFFQWWNTVFPHPESELTNGAMRKTTSAYFGFCNAHHLPDVTDLVIVELDADDQTGHLTTTAFERLIRSILLRPDQPAVLILGHFSTQVYETHGFAGPDHWHNIVAQFYDVPHVSTKPLIFPSYILHPPSMSQFFTDPVLASPKGHTLLSETLIHYFQHQLCQLWAALSASAPNIATSVSGGSGGAGGGLFGGVGHRKDAFDAVAGGAGDTNKDTENGEEDVGRRGAGAGGVGGTGIGAAQLAVPAGLISTRPATDTRPFVEIAPFCVSANDLINPLPPSLFYGSGWSAAHPGSSGSGGSVSAYADSVGGPGHYWWATQPTSKMRIPIVVGAGDIGVYYVREVRGESGSGAGEGDAEGSAVECWVDDNYGGAKLIENVLEGEWGEAAPVLEMIDHFVSTGSHFVECQLLGEEGVQVPEFRIVGVFTT